MKNSKRIPWSRRRLLQAASAVSLLSMFGHPARATPPSRRIGFVDLNLDNFHSNVYLKTFRNELKDRGFSVAGATAIQAENGREWAQKNDVAWFNDVERLAKQVDVFVILAPSNPDVHLTLARQVFPFGKPTFVDKTFAPDLKTAQEIFALADKHNAAVQSASALRYTQLQQHAAKIGRDRIRHLTTFSDGGNFDEYIVHPVEQVVSCLGTNATRLLRRNESQILIDFSDDRTATINLHLKTRTPYSGIVTSNEATEYIEIDTTKLFVDAAAAMLNFFEMGRNDIDRRETLTIMRIIDAAKQPEAREAYVNLT